MRKPLVSGAAGVGVEMVGQGYPIIWPNMPLWLAWLLVVGGGLLIGISAFALVWPHVRQALPMPLWLPSWLWSSIGWVKYRPELSVQDPIPQQAIDGGILKQSEVLFRYQITPKYPHGFMRLGAGQAFLVVRNAGSRKHFKFRVKTHPPIVDLRRGTGTHADNIWFESEDLGRQSYDGPDLTKSFHWTIYRLGAVFYGVRPFERFFPRIKGYLERQG